MNYDIITLKVPIGGEVGEKREEVICIISYKPLFKLLLDKDMTKTQLREAVGFSSSTLAKMTKGEYVSLETIDNICQYLDCKVEEVIEILPTPLIEN